MYHFEPEDDIQDEDENEDRPIGLFGKPARWIVNLLSGYLKSDEEYPVPPKEPLMIDLDDPYLIEAENAFSQLFKNEYS